MQDDHDAEVFVEALLRNGYWVHLGKVSTQEEMDGSIKIEFEKESKGE